MIAERGQVLGLQIQIQIMQIFIHFGSFPDSQGREDSSIK